MAKTIAKSDNAVAEAARRAAAKADTMYQLTVCCGLVLMAAFAGTAGALVLHGTI